MKIKNLLLVGIFLSVIIGGMILINANQPSWTCDNHLTYKECSNGLGNKTLEVFNGFYNGYDYVPYNLTIFKLSQLDEGMYSYKMNGSIYSAEFATNPNWGKIVKFSNGNSSISFLPGDIYYGYDGLSANQEGDYINTIQGGLTGSPNGTEFNYPNAYGNGIDMNYYLNKGEMKEKLMINSNTSIRPPQSWVTSYNTNITFNVNYDLYFSSGVSLYINGSIWDGNKSISTSNAVIVKNSTGQEVFSMPKPIAYDSNGSTVDLTYTFYESSNKTIHVVIATPYSWLSSSSWVYPLTIDPSLTVSSGTTILGGDLSYDSVTVNSGAVIQINSSIGYLNLSANTINIYGTINGKGLYNGTSLGKGGNGAGQNSIQYLPSAVNTYSAGGGGGGGSYSSGASGGSVSYTTAGSGGSAYMSNNSSLVQGSAGGTGGLIGNGMNVLGIQNPGSGGGSIRLFGDTITINGTIDVSGGNGAGLSGSTSGAGGAGGGGGGSGGKLIIEGKIINLTNAQLNSTGGRGSGGHATGVSSYYCFTGGGGGSGGVISINYASSIINSSLQTNLVGGIGGIKSENIDSPLPTCNNGGNGGNGNIYYSQISWNNVVLVPQINSNYTSPIPKLTPSLPNLNYFMNISNPANNSIQAVYFNLTEPNGTIIINNQNGTYISGNVSNGENETWKSPSFTIPFNTSSIGQWNWSFKIDSGLNGTYTDHFTISDITPLVSINSITTANGSQTISFNTTATDVNLDKCFYSVINSTGQVDASTIANKTFTCNSNPQLATVSNYGNYTLNFYANDTLGHLNSTSLGFTTSVSNGTTIIVTGGGGGGATVVGQGNWTMQTTPGQESYDKVLPAGTSTDLPISFSNTGEKALNITLSCEDINGTFCNYVDLGNATFTLPLSKDITLVRTFNIALPQDIASQTAIFNIIGTDSDKNINSISVRISSGNKGVPATISAKLGLNSPLFGLGLPYSIIALFTLIFSLLILGRVLPKDTPLRSLIVFAFSLIATGLVIYYL